MQRAQTVRMRGLEWTLVWMMTQVAFDNWIISLGQSDQKMLSVLLMETLQKCLNIKATAAALEAVWIKLFAIIAKTSWTTKEGLKRQTQESIQGGGLAASMWVRENM